MNPICGRSGVAAVEAALLAPILITLLIGIIDFGAALFSSAQIANALAASAEYATLAGQKGVATATIATNAKTLASAVSNPFISGPTVTAVVNQGNAGAKCCLGTANCGSSPTCTDGSTPGVYLTVTARYTFTPLLKPDGFVLGATLADSIVAPLQ